MSVNVSVSNTENTGCKKIFNILKKSNIDCRLIETDSLVDGFFEKGCLITLGEKYSNPIQLQKIWNLIKKDYTCAHLQIDSKYNGCILDYLRPSKCIGKEPDFTLLL